MRNSQIFSFPSHQLPWTLEKYSAPASQSSAVIRDNIFKLKGDSGIHLYGVAVLGASHRVITRSCMYNGNSTDSWLLVFQGRARGTGKGRKGCCIIAGAILKPDTLRPREIQGNTSKHLHIQGIKSPRICNESAFHSQRIYHHEIEIPIELLYSSFFFIIRAYQDTPFPSTLHASSLERFS